MRLKRFMIFVGLLIVSVIFVAGVWMAIAPESDQRHAFPDGSAVILRDVTHGRRHRLVDAQGWRRMVGRVLAEKFLRRLGIPLISHSTTNDSTVIWLTTDTRMMAGTSAFFDNVVTRVAINDAHGSEIFHTATTGSHSRGNRVLKGYVFQILPPASDDLTVTVHHSNWSANRHYRASFPIPQPKRPKSHHSSAPTLPSTSRVDNLQFVLQAVEMTQASAPGGTEALCKVNGLVLEDDAPTTNWVLRMADVFDDSGAYQRIQASKLPSGQSVLRVGLSTNNVWRLRFHLARNAGFASNDLSTVRELPLTVSERAAFRPVTNAINGVNFVLYDVAGFGAIKLTTFLIPPDAMHEIVLVRAIDNKGRDLATHTTTPGLALKTRPDSSTADVTFGVTPMKFVEVLVQPQSSSTNSSSSFPAPSK